MTVDPGVPVATVATPSIDNHPNRICDVCGVVDRGPRHQVGYTPGTVPVNVAQIKSVIANPDLTDDEKASISADIADTELQLRHMDCCTNVGCPDGSCDLIPNGMTQQEILTKIVTEPVQDQFIALQEAKNAAIIATTAAEGA